MSHEKVDLGMNLEGRLRNFSLPHAKALVPVFEAVVNALHAVDASGRKDGLIRVEVLRGDVQQELALENTSPPIRGYRIEDNGVGFDDANYASFCTSDSTYKLALGGHGVGRLSWIKAFGAVRVQSAFYACSELRQRHFVFSAAKGIVLSASEQARTQPGSVVVLDNVDARYAKNLPKKVDTLAQRIIEHCLVAFRAALKASPALRIVVADGNDEIEVSEAVEQVFRDAQTDMFFVANQSVTVTHVRLAAPLGAHRMAFLADRREVKSESLATSFPQLKSKLEDEKGAFWWLALVESSALDSSVNAERDNFSLPEENLDLLPGELSMEALRSAIVGVLSERFEKFLDPIQQRAEERVRDYVSNTAPEYRHLLKLRKSDVRKLSPDLSDDALDSALHHISYVVEKDVRESGRALIQSASWGDSRELDSFLKESNEVGVASLAKYVVHRRLVLNIFKKALERQSNEKYELEEAVHKIVFPLRKTSDEVPYENLNLWIIDERLAYHHYLASDKRLSAIEPAASDDADRPDLICFNAPFAFADHAAPYSSIVIVEFKRPGRNDYSDEDNPIIQVYDYVRKIRAGRQADRAGRVMNIQDSVPFYCYVICDLTTKVCDQAQNASLTLTPDGMGYFGFNAPLRTYIEVLSFDKVLSDAEKRNRVFFAKLNMQSSS